MKYGYLAGKSILVTGGTGSFGRKCVRTLLKESLARRIIIFSRDELKQSQMQSEFKEFDERLRFFLGDIRDRERLRVAFEDVNYVVHAAALKQVPALEFNPSEAILTNIIGTENVIRAALDKGVEKVLLISTDKAASPANLYGATKLCAEKLTVSSNHYGVGKTLFSAVRYGNVLGSRGSLLQIIEEQRKTGTITLTHREMTRFWMTMDRGVDFVLSSLGRMKGAEIFIPKMPSMRVSELIHFMAPECEMREVGIRPGEKMHEVLITPEEARHAREFDDYYTIYPEFAFSGIGRELEGQPLLGTGPYLSHENADWLDEARLKQLIATI